MQSNYNHSFLSHPTQLDENARANHVFQSILKHNEGIIKNNPSGANAKFQRLQLSPFIFMRGTADLMYQDLAGTDADKALIFCIGDVHLENFGVMECEDAHLTWGVNDFDEATFAPFTWDVKRGAVSIFLATKGSNFTEKQVKKLTKIFSKSYLTQVQGGLSKNTDDYLKIYLIEELLQSVKKINASTWLKKYYLDTKKILPFFKSTKELKPIPRPLFEKRIPIIQQSINDYLVRLKRIQHNAPDSIQVLDLATKTGSGTASIGLWRYYILAEVIHDEQSELIILEMKQMRPSVLSPYVRQHPLLFSSEGERVGYAENLHLQNANPYYGYANLENITYLIRKRSAYKSRIKISKDADYKDFKTYVQACGNALAHAHLLSNAKHHGQNNAAQAILNSIDEANFAKTTTAFAIKMAKQVVIDWESFCKACKDRMLVFEK
jgi:uncharacterized protein (DUF2252 family)